MSEITPNWDPYFIICGKRFDEFWISHLNTNPKHFLFIFGMGFDPRTLTALKRLAPHCPSNTQCDCIFIEYDEGPETPSLIHEDLVKRNMMEFQDYRTFFKTIKKTPIKMWSDNTLTRRRIADIEATRIIANFSAIQGYTDIIVDISAMPKSLYFSLIAKILHLLSSEERNVAKGLPNFFVVVAENVELDKLIEDQGIDEEPKLIKGFASELEHHKIIKIPVIWIPILGENKKVQLENIQRWIEPAEIYPVLPSPSKNPRRGDDIIEEYHQLLFDEWNVDPKNVMYADEENPFDAYRQILQLVQQHTKVLEPLGKCKVAISSDSSKLISLGAILAAYDLMAQKMSVGIVNIEPYGYKINNLESIDLVNRNSDLFTLLLYHDERK